MEFSDEPGDESPRRRSTPLFVGVDSRGIAEPGAPQVESISAADSDPLISADRDSRPSPTSADRDIGHADLGEKLLARRIGEGGGDAIDAASASDSVDVVSPPSASSVSSSPTSHCLGRYNNSNKISNSSSSDEVSSVNLGENVNTVVFKRKSNPQMASEFADKKSSSSRDEGKPVGESRAAASRERRVDLPMDPANPREEARNPRATGIGGSTETGGAGDRLPRDRDASAARDGVDVKCSATSGSGRRRVSAADVVDPGSTPGDTRPSSKEDGAANDAGHGSQDGDEKTRATTLPSSVQRVEERSRVTVKDECRAGGCVTEAEGSSAGRSSPNARGDADVAAAVVSELLGDVCDEVERAAGSTGTGAFRASVVLDDRKKCPRARHIAQECKSASSGDVGSGVKDSVRNCVAQPDGNLPSLLGLSNNDQSVHSVDSVDSLTEPSLSGSESKVSLSMTEHSLHQEHDSNSLSTSESGCSSATGVNTEEDLTIRTASVLENLYENISEDEQDAYDSDKPSTYVSTTTSVGETVTSKDGAEGKGRLMGEQTDSGLGTEASSQSDTELSNQQHTDSDNDCDSEPQRRHKQLSSYKTRSSVAAEGGQGSQAEGRTARKSKGVDPESRDICWQIVDGIVSEVVHPSGQSDGGDSELAGKTADPPRVTCQIPLEKLTQLLDSYGKSTAPGLSPDNSDGAAVCGDVDTSGHEAKCSTNEKGASSDKLQASLPPAASDTASSLATETVERRKLTRTRKKCLKYHEKPVLYKTKGLRSQAEQNTPKSSSEPSKAISVNPADSPKDPSVPIKPRGPQPHKYCFQIHEEHLMKLPGGEKLYACDICSGVYQRAFSLKRHYLRSHINYRHLTERDISNCGIVVNSNMAVSSADNTTIFMQNSKITSTCSETKGSGSQVTDGANSDAHVRSEGPAVQKSKTKDCDSEASEGVGKVTKLAGDATIPERRQLARRDFSETRSRGKKISGCSPRAQSLPRETKLSDALGQQNSGNTSTVSTKDETASLPGLFRCHACGFCFDFKEDLKLHLADHPVPNSGETQPYRCAKCRESFSLKSNFQRHLATHNQPEPVVKVQLCLYCDKTFRTSGILNRHISRMHQPVPKKGKRRKLKVCTFCPEILGKRFRNLRLLFKHMISEHSDIYHGCFDCEIRYESKVSLDMHNKAIHSKKFRNSDSVIAADLQKDVKVDKLVTVGGPDSSSADSVATTAVASVDVNTSETNPISAENISCNNFQYRCAICHKMFTNFVNMCRHKRLAHGKAIAKPKKSDFSPKKYQKYETKGPVRERSPKSTVPAAEVEADTVNSEPELVVAENVGADPVTLFYSRVSDNIRDNLLNHLDGKISRQVSVGSGEEAAVEPARASSGVLNESESGDSTAKPVDGNLAEVQGDELDASKSLDVKSEPEMCQNSFNKDFACMDICTQLTVKRNVEMSVSKPDDQCCNDEFCMSAEDQVSFLKIFNVNPGANNLNKKMYYFVKNVRNQHRKHISQTGGLDSSSSSSKTNPKMSTKKIRRRFSLRQRSTDSDAKEATQGERSAGVSDSDNEDSAPKRTSGSAEVAVEDTAASNGSADDTSVSSRQSDESNSSETSPSGRGTEDRPDVTQQPPSEEAAVEGEKSSKTSEEALQGQSLSVADLPESSGSPASSPDTAAQRAASFEFTGDWVRPRTYVCAACNSRFSDIYDLQEHKWSLHPNAWCSHYEFYDAHLQTGPSDTEGMSLELYQRFLKQSGALGTAVVWTDECAMQCTKCTKSFALAAEFHKHLLDCGGDTTWMLTMFAASPGAGRRNRKWRPFGSRRRRHQGRRGMKRNIPSSPMKIGLQKTRRQNDADAIQRMIANLPAKRSTRRAIQFKEDEIKTRSQATINSVAFGSSFARANLKHRKERAILPQKPAITSILKPDLPESGDNIKKTKFLRKTIISPLQVKPQGAVPKKLTRNSLPVVGVVKNAPKAQKEEVESQVSNTRKVHRPIRLINNSNLLVKKSHKKIEDKSLVAKNVKKSQKPLFTTKIKKIVTRKLTLLKPVVPSVVVNDETVKASASKVNKKLIQTSINFPHRKRMLKSCGMKEVKVKKLKGKLSHTLKHPNRITRRSLENLTTSDSSQTSSPKRIGRPPKTATPSLESNSESTDSPTSSLVSQTPLKRALARRASKNVAVSLKNKAVARAATLKAAKNKSVAVKLQKKKTIAIVKPTESVQVAKVASVEVDEVVVVNVVPPAPLAVEEKLVEKTDDQEASSVIKMKESETSDILAAMRKVMLESEPSGGKPLEGVSANRNGSNEASNATATTLPKGGFKLPIITKKTVVLGKTRRHLETQSVVAKAKSKSLDDLSHIDDVDDATELDSLPLSVIAQKNKLTKNIKAPVSDGKVRKLKLHLQHRKSVGKGTKLNSNVVSISNTSTREQKGADSVQNKDIIHISLNKSSNKKKMSSQVLNSDELSVAPMDQLKNVNVPAHSDLSLSLDRGVVLKASQTKLLKPRIVAKSKRILKVSKAFSSGIIVNPSKTNSYSSSEEFSKEPIMCSGCGAEFSNNASCDRHQKKCVYMQKIPTSQVVSESALATTLDEIVSKSHEAKEMTNETSTTITTCSSCLLEFKTRLGCERHQRNCASFLAAKDSAVVKESPMQLELPSRVSSNDVSLKSMYCPGCGSLFSNASACERHQRKCDIIQNIPNTTDTQTASKVQSETNELVGSAKEVISKRLTILTCRRIKSCLVCRQRKRKCLHKHVHTKECYMKVPQVTSLQKRTKLNVIQSKRYEVSICTVCGLEFKNQAACLRHEKKCIPNLTGASPLPPSNLLKTSIEEISSKTVNDASDTSLTCTHCNLNFRTVTACARHERKCVSAPTVFQAPIPDAVESGSVVNNLTKPTGLESRNDSAKDDSTFVTHESTSKLFQALKPECAPVSNADSGTDSLCCLICKSPFKTQAACDRHQKKCDAEAPEAESNPQAESAFTKEVIQSVTCSDCGATFKSQLTCDRHHKKCGARHKTSEMDINVKSNIVEIDNATENHSVQPIICADCGSEFKNQSACERHRKRCSLPVENTGTVKLLATPSPEPESVKIQSFATFACSLCKMQFKNQVACDRHKKNCATVLKELNLAKNSSEVCEEPHRERPGTPLILKLNTKKEPVVQDLQPPYLEAKEPCANIETNCSGCGLQFSTHTAYLNHQKNCASATALSAKTPEISCATSDPVVMAGSNSIVKSETNCSICGQAFKILSSFLKHKEKCKPTPLLASDILEINTDMLEEHQDVSESTCNKQTNCSACGLCFKGISAFLKHKTKCASATTLPIKTHIISDELVESTKSATNKSTTCSICGICFKGHVAYLKHQKNYHPTPPTAKEVTDGDDVVPTTPLETAKHENTETSCSECGAQFKGIAACLKHKRKCSTLPSLNTAKIDNSASASLTETVSCNNCGLKLKTLSSLLKHKKKCTMNISPSNSTDIETKVSVNSLEPSQLTENTETNCNLCGLDFKSLAAWLKHQKKCTVAILSTKVDTDLSSNHIEPIEVAENLERNCLVCGVEFKSVAIRLKHQKKCSITVGLDVEDVDRSVSASRLSEPAENSETICTLCGTLFKSRTSLFKHQKKCDVPVSSSKITEVDDSVSELPDERHSESTENSETNCSLCGLELKNLAEWLKHQKKCTATSSTLTDDTTAEVFSSPTEEPSKRAENSETKCTVCGLQLKSLAASIKHQNKCAASVPSSVSDKVDADCSTPPLERSKSAESPEKCSVCGIECKSLAAWLRHQKKCSDTVPSIHNVEINNTVDGSEKLPEMAVSTSDLNTTCNVCSLGFNDHAECLKHQKKCTPVPPCLPVDKVTADVSATSVETVKLTDKPKHLCTFCGIEFKVFPTYLKHRKKCASRLSNMAKINAAARVLETSKPGESAGADSTTPLPSKPCDDNDGGKLKNTTAEETCTVCGLKFKGSATYLKHQKKCALNSNANVESSGVAKSNTAVALSSTKSVGLEKEAPHISCLCGLKLKTQVDLKKHKQKCSHASQKKKHIKKTSMIVETKKAHLKEALICRDCGLEFRVQAAFARHKKKCMQARKPRQTTTNKTLVKRCIFPYFCHGCDKKFTYKGSFISHRLTCIKLKSLEEGGSKENVKNESVKSSKSAVAAAPDTLAKKVEATTLDVDKTVPQAGENTEDDIDIPEDVPLAYVIARKFKNSNLHVQRTLKKLKRPIRQLRKSPIKRDKNNKAMGAVRKSSRISVARMSFCNDKSDSEENMPELEIQEPIPNLPVVSPTKSGSDLSDIPILSPITDLPLALDDDKPGESTMKCNNSTTFESKDSQDVNIISNLPEEKSSLKSKTDVKSVVLPQEVSQETSVSRSILKDILCQKRAKSTDYTEIVKSSNASPNISVLPQNSPVKEKSSLLVFPNVISPPKTYNFKSDKASVEKKSQKQLFLSTPHLALQSSVTASPIPLQSETTEDLHVLINTGTIITEINSDTGVEVKQNQSKNLFENTKLIPKMVKHLPSKKQTSKLIKKTKLKVNQAKSADKQTVDHSENKCVSSVSKDSTKTSVLFTVIQKKEESKVSKTNNYTKSLQASLVKPTNLHGKSSKTDKSDLTKASKLANNEMAALIKPCVLNTTSLNTVIKLFKHDTVAENKIELPKDIGITENSTEFTDKIPQKYDKIVSPTKLETSNTTSTSDQPVKTTVKSLRVRSDLLNVKPSDVKGNLAKLQQPSNVCDIKSLSTSVESVGMQSELVSNSIKPLIKNDGSKFKTDMKSPNKAVHLDSVEMLPRDTNDDDDEIMIIEPTSVEQPKQNNNAHKSILKSVGEVRAKCSGLPEVPAHSSKLQNALLGTVAKQSKLKTNPLVKQSAEKNARLQSKVNRSKLHSALIGAVVKPLNQGNPIVIASVKPIEEKNISSVPQARHPREKRIHLVLTKSTKMMARPSKVVILKHSKLQPKPQETVTNQLQEQNLATDSAVKVSKLHSPFIAQESIASKEIVDKPAKVHTKINVKSSKVEAFRLVTIGKSTKVTVMTKQLQKANTIAQQSIVTNAVSGTVVKPSKPAVNCPEDVLPKEKSKHHKTDWSQFRMDNIHLVPNAKPTEVIINPTKVHEHVSRASNNDNLNQPETLLKPSVVFKPLTESVIKHSKVDNISHNSTINPNEAIFQSLHDPASTNIQPTNVNSANYDKEAKSIEAITQPIQVFEMSENRVKTVDITEQPSNLPKTTVTKTSKVDSTKHKILNNTAAVCKKVIAAKPFDLNQAARLKTSGGLIQSAESYIHSGTDVKTLKVDQLKSTAKTHNVLVKSKPLADVHGSTAAKLPKVDREKREKVVKTTDTLGSPLEESVIRVNPETSTVRSKTVLVDLRKDSHNTVHNITKTEIHGKTETVLKFAQVTSPNKDPGNYKSEILSTNTDYANSEITPNSSKSILEVDFTSTSQAYKMSTKSDSPLKSVESSNAKNISKQQTVFEAFTYIKTANETVDNDKKQADKDSSFCMVKTSPEPTIKSSPDSVSVKEPSELSNSFTDMFTNIKFKRRVLESMKGKGGKSHSDKEIARDVDIQELLAIETTPKKKRQSKGADEHIDTSYPSAPSSNLDSSSESKIISNKVKVISQAKCDVNAMFEPNQQKSDSAGNIEQLVNKKTDDSIDEQNKIKNKIKKKIKKSFINLQKVKMQKSQIKHRGRSKQRTTNRGRKRSMSPYSRRTSLRSPVARFKSSVSPIRRREGSVRRTRCYLSYEEMYTSDVGSDESSLDFFEPHNVPEKKQTTSSRKTSKSAERATRENERATRENERATRENERATRENERAQSTPVPSPEVQKLTSSVILDSDTQPKSTIVEKITYEKGSVGDLKANVESDNIIIKEHVVKDLSSPSYHHKEDTIMSGKEVITSNEEVQIDLATSDIESSTKEKKQRRRNLNLDTAYYCTICSKHYYSNYNLNKHKVSTLHKYNVSKLETGSEAIGSNEPDKTTDHTNKQLTDLDSQETAPNEETPSIISFPNDGNVANTTDAALQEDIRSNSCPIENEVMINHAFGNYESVSYWLEQQTGNPNDYDLSENESVTAVDNLNWTSESMPSRLVEGLPKRGKGTASWGDSRNESSQNSQADNSGLLDEVSLKELQRAMGVTDEEMMMLQHLGETNINSEWPLQEVQLTDLDNQRAGGVIKIRSSEMLVEKLQGENVPVGEKEPSAHVVAEGLKSHMVSALGRLLERALTNICKPDNKLVTSPLNRPTLELLQKLSKLYSEKTGKTLNEIKINELANLGGQSQDETSAHNTITNSERDRSAMKREVTDNLEGSPDKATESQAVKDTEPKYACPICDSKFEMKKSINYHIARAHKIADKYMKVHRGKHGNIERIKKEPKRPVEKDLSDDESVHNEATCKQDPSWLSNMDKPKQVQLLSQDIDSFSSNTSGSIQIVSDVKSAKEKITTIFTDDDVDNESPLEMLANQCLEIANRLGNSEDSRSMDVSDSQASQPKQSSGKSWREVEGTKSKGKDSVPKIHSKNAELTKTKSKILQSVYLPSKKKAKLFANEGAKSDIVEKDKGKDSKDQTPSQKNNLSIGAHLTAVKDKGIKEELNIDVKVDPDVGNPSTSINEINERVVKKKVKKAKVAEVNSDREEERLKAEAALRDLNKRSRGNQKVNWGLLKFTKSSIQRHKNLGHPSKKYSKGDSKLHIPVAVNQLTTDGTGQCDKDVELDGDLLQDGVEERCVEKSAVDVYEFDDDEISASDIDLGFRHQNGVSPKTTTVAPPTSKVNKELKAKHKSIKSDDKDLPCSPDSEDKKANATVKIKVLKNIAKPKKLTDNDAQDSDEEGITPSQNTGPPKSIKDNSKEKTSPGTTQSASIMNTVFDELLETSAKNNPSKIQGSGEEDEEDVTLAELKAGQENTVTKPKSQKRKRKSVQDKTLPDQTESNEVISKPDEQDKAKTTEEAANAVEEMPKTRRGRNHVCYTEIYDDIFSDMEDFDLTNFEEPTRKKAKKTTPKGKNKNDILSCVFGKGRRNSTITIGSDISDMDRECIAQAKSIDNDWDTGDALS